MTTVGERAIDHAEAQHKAGLFPKSECLKRVRLCFGVGPDALTAAKGWAMSNHKHRASAKNCPRGVPVWWVGGSSGAGHVAISLGNGLCETTDYVRAGGFGVAHIEDITRDWHLTFEGWTEDINGERVYTIPPTPAPKPVVPLPVAPENAYLRYKNLLVAAQKVGKSIPKNHPARRRLYETVEKAIAVSPKVRVKK